MASVTAFSRQRLRFGKTPGTREIRAEEIVIMLTHDKPVARIVLEDEPTWLLRSRGGGRPARLAPAHRETPWGQADPDPRPDCAIDSGGPTVTGAFVVDASVGFAWVHPRPGGRGLMRSRGRRSGRATVVAPALWFLEVATGSCRYSDVNCSLVGTKVSAGDAVGPHVRHRRRIRHAGLSRDVHVGGERWAVEMTSCIWRWRSVASRVGARLARWGVASRGEAKRRCCLRYPLASAVHPPDDQERQYVSMHTKEGSRDGARATHREGGWIVTQHFPIVTMPMVRMSKVERVGAADRPGGLRSQ